MRISVLSVLENNSHYVKRVRIWSFSGSHFPAFGLNRDTPFLSIFSPNAGKYGPEKLQIRTLSNTLINHIFDEEMLL